MISNKKRIRSFDLLKKLLNNGDKFIIGIKDLDRFEGKLKETGFSENLEVGESILPSASFGPISYYNAEGKYIIHKDRPMETVYRTVEWHWHQWHGRYDRVERTKMVDVPHKRYPRTFINPPSIEFTISTTVNGERVKRNVSGAFLPADVRTNVIDRLRSGSTVHFENIQVRRKGSSKAEIVSGFYLNIL